MGKVLSIARHELSIMIKSKWLLHFSLLFTTLALLISLLGSSSYTGYDGFTSTIANLLNLSLLLIPLISLLFGSMNWAGEEEEGWLDLLRTYPLEQRSLIHGKYVGLLLGMFAVISIGFAISGLILAFQSSLFPIATFLLFWLASLILAAIFIALSLFLGTLSKNRIRALGMSLIVWAWLLLFYEFFLYLIASWLPVSWIVPFLLIALFLNPVELVRSWVIISMESGILFGPELYSFVTWANTWYGQLVYLGGFLLWIILPLTCTNWMGRRVSDG